MNDSLAVINPLSGETLDLKSAPDDDIARFLDSIRDYESQLREAKALVSQEIIERMDHRTDWTMRAGGHVLKAPSPKPTVVYDELALREDLLQLVDEGKLTPEAVDAAIETIVTYKARAAGLNKLAKRPDVAPIIGRHASYQWKTRYVSMSRPS